MRMKIREHTFKIDLMKGETAVIYPKGTSPDCVVVPQPEDVTKSHAWGLH